MTVLISLMGLNKKMTANQTYIYLLPAHFQN